MNNIYSINEQSSTYCCDKSILSQNQLVLQVVHGMHLLRNMEKSVAYKAFQARHRKISIFLFQFLLCYIHTLYKVNIISMTVVGSLLLETMILFNIFRRVPFNY